MGAIGERGMLIETNLVREASLRRALTDFIDHFHAERNHQAIK
jgi:hypothetical protein